MQLLIDAGKAFIKMAVYVTIAALFVGKTAKTLAHSELGASGIAGALRASGMDLLLLFLLAAGIFAASIRSSCGGCSPGKCA